MATSTNHIYTDLLLNVRYHTAYLILDPKPYLTLIEMRIVQVMTPKDFHPNVTLIKSTLKVTWATARFKSSSCHHI